MISRRFLVITLLLLVPVLVYIGFGAYALWQTGLFRWTWWIIPLCWCAVYALSRVWRRPRFGEDPLTSPHHWTPTDESASEVIRRHQEQVEQYTSEQLTDLQFYVKSSQKLAEDLSRHYHPNAKNPLQSLTVVEVLAAIRLAVDDLEDWFQDSIPGSHLVTIEQWRALSSAPKWIKRASNAGWFASLLWNPLNAAKYLTSRLTLGPLTDELKDEILAAVYLRFIRHLGFYLIEMNSGRLRRGARRYQQVFGEKISNDDSANVSSESPEFLPKSVVIAVIGQTNAGKSSVINALIGERSAETDSVPSTQNISRYVLKVPDSNETITLLDTPGYADADAPRIHKKFLQMAIEQADIVLLVIDAHQPARNADLEVLRAIEAEARNNPQFLPPPIVVCLTHVDLLSPMMEWSPPYDLDAAVEAKAVSIRDAVDATRQLFQNSVADVVPVCSGGSPDRIDNIDPGLITAITQSLEVGKSVGILRAYEAELDRDRWKAILTQLKNSGAGVVNLWLDERLHQSR